MKNLILLVIIFSVGAITLPAQTTAFTYQGHLTDGGASANGNYDIQFTLKNALTAGSTVGSPQAVSPVQAVNGIFNVTPNDHQGFDQRARVMVTIEKGTWKLTQ